MASSGKKKTTMAKLQRESRLRERRLDKAARKDARKLAAANGEPTYSLEGEAAHQSEHAGGPSVEAVVEALADA